VQVIVLASEKLAGAPKAGLHLVDDEQRPTLRAQRLHPLQVLARADMHTALALHYLYQHGGGVIAHRLTQRLEVAVGHVAESRNQGHERLPVLGLPRRRERAHGSPVKAAHHGHDPRPAGAQPGQLESRLHRLGARVAQVGAFQASRRDG